MMPKPKVTSCVHSGHHHPQTYGEGQRQQPRCCPTHEEIRHEHTAGRSPRCRESAGAHPGQVGRVQVLQLGLGLPLHRPLRRLRLLAGQQVVQAHRHLAQLLLPQVRDGLQSIADGVMGTQSLRGGSRDDS